MATQGFNPVGGNIAMSLLLKQQWPGHMTHAQDPSFASSSITFSIFVLTPDGITFPFYSSASASCAWCLDHFKTFIFIFLQKPVTNNGDAALQEDIIEHSIGKHCLSSQESRGSISDI